ncbi:MAG: putative toxin-antitoxin system toxin component, PIN family [Thermomicrobiales bacterium]
MIRAVLDANVLISGALAAGRPDSLMGQIIRSWEHRQFELVCSEPLIEEVARNLTSLRFSNRLNADDVEAFIRLLRQESEMVGITGRIQGTASHPEDDRILETALSSGANYLVTGDKQLLALAHIEDVVIVGARDFLEAVR